MLAVNIWEQVDPENVDTVQEEDTMKDKWSTLKR
jgi:hypothetical protein